MALNWRNSSKHKKHQVFDKQPELEKRAHFPVQFMRRHNPGTIFLSSESSRFREGGAYMGTDVAAQSAEGCLGEARGGT